MFPEPSVVFHEFVMGEDLPLATVHAAVLEFLRDRSDVAIFGAQAVNAYVDTPRMTQDVDVLTTNGEEFAEELCGHLHQLFHMAVRVRRVASGSGYRIYQLRSPSNRHLVDVRHISTLPACERIENIQVVAPAELLAMKVISMTARSKTPKGLTDEADLMRMLLVFPKYKTMKGDVADSLARLNASDRAFVAWHELVDRNIQPEIDDDW